MDLSASEWHCRCTLSARWAGIGSAGGEDRVTHSILLHYVRFIFADVQFIPVWVCQVVVRQSTTLRLLSGMWNHHSSIAKHVFPRYVRQICLADCSNSASKSFPPDLIWVFLVLLLIHFLTKSSLQLRGIIARYIQVLAAGFLASRLNRGFHTGTELIAQ